MATARLIRRSVRMAGALVYRHLLVVGRSLVEPDPEIDASVPLSLGFLARHEIAEYLSFHPGETFAEIERRLDRNDVCFLARSGGRMVGAMWTARRSSFVRYLRTEFTIAQDEVYLYDVYTAGAWRGRKIAPALYRRVFQHYRPGGVRLVVGALLPENHASMRSLASTGFRVIGRVGYLALGPWRRHFRRDA
jgi:GNAT superfamily N-acetyltransferase